MAGFVQFEPNEREANGRTVKDVLIVSIGSGGKKVRITVWPELGENVELAKGDFVAAEGKFTQNTVNGTTYLNISASDLFVGKPVPKSSDEVVNSVDSDDEDDAPF